MKNKKKGKIETFIVINILLGAFLCGVCFGEGIFYSNKKDSKAALSSSVYAEKINSKTDTSIEKNTGDKEIYVKAHSTKTASDNQADNNVNKNNQSGSNNTTNNNDGIYIQTKIVSSDGEEKVAYLTFDDGPTYTTPKILDILDKYNIKATFFVVGSMCTYYPQYLKREYAEGEYICNHTYSHEYNYIYSDPKNFIADVKKCEKTIDSILGINYKTTLVRFPGGSFDKAKVYKDDLTGAGYSYVDWNALSGDAERKNVPVDELIKNVKDSVAHQKKVIILMHDCTQMNTVTALPAIIEYLKSQGYVFKTLKEV